MEGEPDDPPSRARRSGALTAVFSRSNYVRIREQTYAAIPAGTIFYFGDVDPAAAEPIQGSGIDEADGRLDLRVDATLPLQEQGMREPMTKRIEGTNLSIWAIETYRQNRVSRLLGAASRAVPSEKAPDHTPDS